MIMAVMIVVVVICIGVTFILGNTYFKLYKRRKNSKGKMFCIFRKPSGEYDFEFCVVKGQAIFRGVSDYASIKNPSDLNDVRIGREVYFLKQSEPSYYLVNQTPKNGHKEGVEEAVGAVVGGKGKKGADTGVYMGPRGKIMSRREFDEAKAADPTLEGQLASAGRGHALFPIMTSGWMEPQISVPVAVFIEGKTLECDPLDLALESFGVDPQYNAAMVGNILDEKLTKLWAWWSNRFEDLLQKLSKQVNPTIMYIILGGLVIGLLVCIGLIYSMKGDISDIKDAIPKVGTQ